MYCIMEKKKTKAQSAEGKKRAGRPRTGLTQKHFSFRIDLDLLPWLSKKCNKGRFINLLLWEAFDREVEFENLDCADQPTDPADLMP